MAHDVRTQCSTCGTWYWAGDAHTCPPSPADLCPVRPGTTVRYSIDAHLVPRLRAVLTHPAVTVVRRPLTKKDTTVKIAKTTLSLTVAAAFALGLTACVPLEPVADPTVTTTQEVAPPAQKPAEPAPKPEPAEPEFTVSQEQAVISADGYLTMGGFSRSGLIGQLEYEGFSTDDATFAVDALSPDWDEQAAISAAGYMEMGGFSAQSLLDQLLYEGFTQEQAAHGVATVGL
jgi:hypothetical protein